MKKTILRIFVPLVVLASLSSCASFLNVDQIGKSTINTFFTDISSFEAAGEGLHAELEKFYSSRVLIYGEVAGVNLQINTVDAGQDYKLAFNFQIKPEDSATYCRTIWTQGYSVLSSANYLITYGERYIQTAKESEVPTLKKVLGWAYMGRALAIFDLCRCFGQTYTHTADASHLGVPLMDHVPGFDEAIPRHTVAESYKFVLDNTFKAMEYLGELQSLPATEDAKTHINTIACEAFLARVYLHMEDWENAEKYSKIVMNKVSLSPRSEYVAMFRNARANLGTECILRMNAYDCTTSMLGRYDPTGNTHDFNPDPEIFKMFGDDDVRKELLTYVPEDCEPEEFKGKTFPACCKHLPLKSITDPNDKHPWEFIFRVSEMYLIHAEALAHLNRSLDDAASDIKALMARATGKTPEEIKISYNTASDLLTVIEKERVRELCFEGHSFFDIKRRKQDLVRNASSNADLLKLSYPDYRFVLPIDFTEMRANESIIQNEGYSSNF